MGQFWIWWQIEVQLQLSWQYLSISSQIILCSSPFWSLSTSQVTMRISTGSISLVQNFEFHCLIECKIHQTISTNPDISLIFCLVRWSTAKRVTRKSTKNNSDFWNYITRIVMFCLCCVLAMKRRCWVCIFSASLRVLWFHSSSEVVNLELRKSSSSSTCLSSSSNKSWM